MKTLIISVLFLNACTSTTVVEPRKPCSYTLIKTYELPERERCPKIMNMLECFRFQTKLNANLRSQANKQLETVKIVNRGYLEYRKLSQERTSK